MRGVLYFIAGLLLANILAATFIWPPGPRTMGRPEPLVNDATRQGQDPWMANEKYQAPYRDFLRREMLKTLDKPWSVYCSTEGHDELVRSVNNYYEQRASLAWSYGNTYGDVARDFAVRAWDTADDKRIERLISERYEQGYVAPDDLHSAARKALSVQLRQGRVSARPCSS